MKKNGFAPLIMILVIVVLGVIGYFGLKNNPFPSKTPAPSQDWNLLNCSNCDVIRVTESVWNGPLKSEPDKVWEIEAKTGIKTSDSRNGWQMEVVSIGSSSAKVKFTGNIYKDLVLVKDPLEINKWSRVDFDLGTSGGGASWEIFYFQKGF